MGLAEKLQAAHLKVNTKLGFQDKTIKLAKRTKTSGGIGEVKVGTGSLIELEGARVGLVSARMAKPSGPYEIDDLSIIFPASLATKAQIEGAHILYGDEEFQIVHFAPAKVEGTPAVMGGQVINWQIIAGKRK